MRLRWIVGGGAATTILVLAVAIGPASQASTPREKAGAAVARVEREMRSDGAGRSRLRGCWTQRRRIMCVGQIDGRDESVRWRCIMLLTLRQREKSYKIVRIEPTCAILEY